LSIVWFFYILDKLISKKLSKKILRIEPEYDFNLIAISANCRDYRLCWFINKYLGLNFYREKDDLPIFNEQGERYEIASYRHTIEELESNLYLLPNNNVSGYLAPEIKEIDFFILSTLIMNTQDEKDFIKALNQIDIIQTAYAIDPYSLKSRDNFLIF
jgi:hypothetical protein